MHAHFDISEGLLNLASGVTTVRDLGNDMDELLAWKHEVDANEMIGPRVWVQEVTTRRRSQKNLTNHKKLNDRLSVYTPSPVNFRPNLISTVG